MKKCKKCKHSERCVLAGQPMSIESLRGVVFYVVSCKVRKGKLQLVVE